MITAAHSARSYFRALVRTAGWRLALVVGLGAGTALTEGAAILLLLPLLAEAGTGTTGEPDGIRAVSRLAVDNLGVGGTLALWAGIFIGYGVLGAARERLAAAVQHGFADRCRTQLFAAAAGMEWQAFVRNRSAHILHALTGLQGRIAVGTAQVLQGTVQSLVVLTYVVIALLVEPLGGTLLVLAGLVLLVLQLPLFRHALWHGGREVAGGRALHALVGDHLAGMQMAKSWGAEARQVALFRAMSAGIAASAEAAATERARSLLVLRVAQALMVAAGLWVCLEWLGLRGASLLLIAAVPIRLLPVVVALVHAIRSTAEMLPAWEAMEAALLQYRQAAEPAPPAAPAPAGPITLDSVAFAWADGAGAPAIAGIDLVIPERRTTALVGRSGAGKSTLAGIVLGMLVPTGGTVRVGGTALEGGARRAWRTRSAYVPQEVALLGDTVRANLAWADPAASEPAMWAALESAAVADVVRRLPQGLDTVLGDRGATLSGGERQRLAIAQALLRRPALLVLDEATSHLDRESEQRVRESLARLHGEVTVLLIAHRLPTVRDADHIAVLDGGRLVEQGCWDALMARRGGALHRLAMGISGENGGS